MTWQEQIHNALVDAIAVLDKADRVKWDKWDGSPNRVAGLLTDRDWCEALAKAVPLFDLPQLNAVFQDKPNPRENSETCANIILFNVWLCYNDKNENRLDMTADRVSFIESLRFELHLEPDTPIDILERLRKGIRWLLRQKQKSPKAVAKRWEGQVSVDHIIVRLASLRDELGDPLPVKELWSEFYSRLEEEGLKPCDTSGAEVHNNDQMFWESNSEGMTFKTFQNKIGEIR